MLRLPNETTEPGRESDINLCCSSSATGGLGVGTGIMAASELGISVENICLEYLRGGGDSDVICGNWSGIGGKARGGGEDGSVGVSNCKKLGSFWKDVIFSAIGVVGCEIRVAVARLAVWTILAVMVSGRDDILAERLSTDFVTGVDGALSIRNLRLSRFSHCAGREGATGA